MNILIIYFQNMTYMYFPMLMVKEQYEI